MEQLKRIPVWFFLVAGSIVIVGYVVFVVVAMAEGYAEARKGGQPLYTDFTPKYAASVLVNREPAANLYIPERMVAATMDTANLAYGGTLNERQAGSVGFSAWMYPPYFIFIIYPLAFLPYLMSLFAWLSLTFVPYFFVLAQAIGRRGAWLLGLASPAAFYNIMFGQTGFLSGGLVGLGLSLVRSRPVLSGICIGLASVKPHLGLLIPLALVAGEHWKPFGVAVITIVVLVVASIFAFGADPWYGLVGTLDFYSQGFGAGAYDYVDLVTVQGMLHLMGASQAAAWKGQLFCGVVMAVLVAGAWWHRRSTPAQLGLQLAVLCPATLLAVPMAYCYDLVMLMPGAAWLWADMRGRGASLLEVSCFAIALSAILPLKAIAGAFHFQYGPLISLALLCLAFKRLWELRDQVVVGPASREGAVGL